MATRLSRAIPLSSSGSKRALSEKQTSSEKPARPLGVPLKHPEHENLLSDLLDKEKEQIEKDHRPQDIFHRSLPPVRVPLYITLRSADSNYHSSSQLARHITIRLSTTLLDLQDGIKQELRVLRLISLSFSAPKSFLWTTTYGEHPVDSCTWESHIPSNSLKWRSLEQHPDPEQPTCLKHALGVECHGMTETQFQKLWKRGNIYEEKYGQYHWRTMGWRDEISEKGFYVGNWEAEEELKGKIQKAIDRKGGLMAYRDWRKGQVYDDN